MEFGSMENVTAFQAEVIGIQHAREWPFHYKKDIKSLKMILESATATWTIGLFWPLKGSKASQKMV